MKVIVRNVQSGKYFKAPGIWTNNLQEAYDFKGTYQAIESKVWAKDEPIEIVFSFGEKRYDVSIHVGSVESRVSPRPSPGKNASRLSKSSVANPTLHPDPGNGKSEPAKS